MESFRNNRYQLLYLDDEASDGDQKATKRNRRSAYGKKAVQLKRKAALNSKLDEEMVATADCKGNGRQQVLRQQLKQQLKRQLKQLLEQRVQQQLDPLMKLHHQYKDRAIASRIISNNNKGPGYGYAGMYKYDRHSGSNKAAAKAMVKRNWAGAHNWGSVIEDIEVQSIAARNNLFNNQQQQQSGQNAIGEDDTKYITIEEWRTMHVKRAKPVYNIRKAGEGEANMPDWKKMIVLSKKQPQKMEYMEYDSSIYPQRVDRLHRVMDIEFKFKDHRCRSGWTGDRSRERL